MSYILDALRKSDQQRQRGTSPTLLTAHAAPAAPQQPAFIWYGALAVILLAAGLALIWFHFMQQQPLAPAMPPVAATPIDTSSREVATVHVPAPPVRRLEPELPARKAAPVIPTTPAQPLTHGTPAPSVQGKTETKGAVPTTVVVGSKNTTPAAIPAEVPIVGWGDLPPQIRQEIPRLSIAVHAYAKEPKGRLVTIDNRMLHEGDEAAPGLRLEQITQDGMIFSYKGYRFRRSVQDVVNNR